MITIETLLLFTGASILLALAPGPDIIFVITQGIIKGKKAAIATTLGLSSGVLVHTTAAAFGISIIFKTSALAFTLVKFLGAAYLFYLAFLSFKHRNAPIMINEEGKIKSESFKKLYAKGFIMNVLNPKVAIFFLAFLPQFVNATNGSIPAQMIQLGIIFMMVTVCVFSLSGILANKASETLMKKPNFAKVINTISSLVFVSLGLKLAFSER